MKHCWLIAALLILPLPLRAGDRILTPLSAVAAAYADLKTLPYQTQKYTRYFSMFTVPPDRRESAWRVLCGHCNGLSTESDIVPLHIMPGTAGGLLRLNLQDYAWKAETWEQLADVDPYYHANIEFDQEYGHYVYSPNRDTKVWITTEKKKERKRAIAPWVTEGSGQEAIKYLVAKTYSSVPIVEGVWFFQQTAVAADRKPNYYDFLGVKNLKDFEKLVGFDATLAKGRDLREAVAMSGVSLQPRRIIRDKSIDGALWRTLDNARATDKNNPLRILDDGDFKFDATEAFAPLRNGMMAWVLANKDGVLQTEAPANIAPKDTNAKWNDGRIHVGLACIRCHGPESGIKNIDYWVRGLMTPPLKLQSSDYDKLKQLRQQYLRNLEPYIDDDRRIYTRAIKEATGFSSAQWSQEYGEMWYEYEEAGVDMKVAARELGITVECLSEKFETNLKLSGLGDFVLAGLWRGKTIGRRQWEESYADAQRIIRSVR